MSINYLCQTKPQAASVPLSSVMAGGMYANGSVIVTTDGKKYFVNNRVMNNSNLVGCGGVHCGGHELCK